MKDSRFAYRERPNLSPGSCAVCKGHGPVIDYMVNVPILGRLYICVDCLKGGLSNVPLSAEEESLEYYKSTMFQYEMIMEKQNAQYRALRDMLGSWILAPHPSPDNPHVDRNSSPVGNEQRPAGKDSVPARKKSKSASKQDADGISSDSDNVDGLFL